VTWSVEEQPACVKSLAEAREDAMAGKGKKSKQKKKLVKKLAKKVIKKAKKEETEVDRSDVKPPSPFSS
jgi:ElaB/YqjD/DUF883 family membrane-anchored ribosome-binding protein